MKKLGLTLVMTLLMGAAAMAQSQAFMQIYNKYQDNPNFTVVSINQKMFSLFSNFEMDDPEDQQAMEAISKLKGMKILAADTLVDGNKLYNSIYNSLSKNFEELMSVRDDGQNVKFLIKENGGKIDELILLVGGKDKFVAMSLYGTIDLKNISKLSKGLNINGSQYLKNLDDDKDHHSDK